MSFSFTPQPTIGWSVNSSVYDRPELRNSCSTCGLHLNSHSFAIGNPIRRANSPAVTLPCVAFDRSKHVGDISRSALSVSAILNFFACYLCSWYYKAGLETPLTHIANKRLGDRTVHTFHNEQTTHLGFILCKISFVSIFYPSICSIEEFNVHNQLTKSCFQ